jgi:hypothetical protein
MNIFDKDGKINYVDSNNRFVGYSMYQSCCESFGHGVFDHVPKTEHDEFDIDITPYNFVDEPPIDCMEISDSGGGLAFRIVSEGLPDAFVVIWNYHNGYYAHGFEYWDGHGSI